jgi:hypothetical protein
MSRGVHAAPATTDGPAPLWACALAGSTLPGENAADGVDRPAGVEPDEVSQAIGHVRPAEPARALHPVGVPADDHVGSGRREGGGSRRLGAVRAARVVTAPVQVDDDDVVRGARGPDGREQPRVVEVPGDARLRGGGRVRVDRVVVDLRRGDDRETGARTWKTAGANAFAASGPIPITGMGLDACAASVSVRPSGP